ncbi:MAG TPA: hypothetical protein VHF58_07090 [Solirubrobacterales bacterium]|nr:hypothetical protein [Solirubrobacterales bacterium]
MRPDQSTSARIPALCLAFGASVSLVTVPLAAVAGPPYLSLGSLSPWIVAFAIGLFAAAFAAPFVIHASLGGRLEADARWERALLWWGAASLAAVAVGLALGLPSGFASDSLPGSLGLVIVVEAVLVLGTLAAWLLAGG